MISVNEFEGTSIPYMFRQAGLSFFRLASYPIYNLEEGKVVVSTSEETIKLQARADQLHKLIASMASRVERQMEIPKTWKETMRVEAAAIILALRDVSGTYMTWVDEFERMIRFLEVY